MKKIKFKFLVPIIVGALIGAIAGCKKDNPAPPTHAEPSISSLFMHFFRHNATDSIPVLPHGIAVHLYASISDLNNRTNQIGATLTPDSFGQIPLPASVEKKPYYWWAEMDANCLYSVGSVDASINITHSTYAELTSPDTLFVLSNDTCSTCKTYNIYIKPPNDYLASKSVFIGAMKWNTIHNTLLPDTIANLPIGIDSVRITRDTTLRIAKAGIQKTDTLNRYNDSTNYGLVFSAVQAFKLVSVDVYNSWKTGTIILELQDNTGTAITGVGKNPDTLALTVSNGLNTVVLNWNIPVQNDMRLVRMAGGTVDSLSYTPGGLTASLPITINSINFGTITNGYPPGNATDYNVAYNWNVSYILHPAVDTTFAVPINCQQGTILNIPHY